MLKIATPSHPPVKCTWGWSRLWRNCPARVSSKAKAARVFPVPEKSSRSRILSVNANRLDLLSAPTRWEMLRPLGQGADVRWKCTSELSCPIACQGKAASKCIASGLWSGPKGTGTGVGSLLHLSVGGGGLAGRQYHHVRIFP